MPIALFSWETDSIVFKYGIPQDLPDSDAMIWRDDHQWVLHTYIITSVIASNIMDDKPLSDYIRSHVPVLLVHKASSSY